MLMVFVLGVFEHLRSIVTKALIVEHLGQLPFPHDPTPQPSPGSPFTRAAAGASKRVFLPAPGTDPRRECLGRVFRNKAPVGC